MKFGRLIWIFLIIVVIGAGGYLRFAGLELKAMHHDESVNYAFTKKLIDEGTYAYNPTAYHGPFLYYIGLPAALIGHYTKTALRFTPALFGLWAVILLLLTHRTVGKPGALFAAAVLALSPADVYFSKTFIHEIYFAFAYAGMYWAFLAAARERRPAAIVAFWVFLSISFAVKETAAFGVVAFGLAIFAARLTARVSPEHQVFEGETLLGRPGSLPLLWGISIALLGWLLLFSSFFTNPRGLLDFFGAYLSWFDTGVKSRPHVKSWTYFFVLVGKYYWPVLPFAFWAAIRGFWKRRPQTVALFAVALFLQIIYSVIPYKTPWCILTIGLGWIVLGAEGFTDLWNILRYRPLQIALGVVVLAGLTAYGLFAYQLSFMYFDYNHDRSYKNDQGVEIPGYAMVYVQTLREYEKMPEDLARISRAAGYDGNLPIFLSSGAKNPGRFYLQHYKKVSRRGGDSPEEIKQPVIVARSTEWPELEKKLTGPYVKAGEYPVFPGWTIYLMVQEDLWRRIQNQMP